MRRALALLPMFVALMVGGCDRAPGADPVAARPAMWLVEDADTRIVILGSVHQLPRDLDWVDGRVAAEISRAQEAILELAPAELERAPALFAATSSDEPVAPIARRFGPATATRARDRAAEAGIGADEADAMESWALALVIGQRMAHDAGLTTQNGVEARVTELLASNGRPIAGFETAALQLGMFDALSELDQNAMVRSVLADENDAPARTRRLLAAWARGDTDALAAVADAEMADTPALIEPVIHARNRAWAEALVARMRRPGRVLVAVGAGHLVGSRSLIVELERRGLPVRRLQ